MIYHACLRTHQQVHAMGLGLTNYVMFFVEADSHDSASTKVVRHMKSRYNTDAVVATITTALRQRKSSYAFPDSII